MAFHCARVMCVLTALVVSACGRIGPGAADRRGMTPVADIGMGSGGVGPTSNKPDSTLEYMKRQDEMQGRQKAWEHDHWDIAHPPPRPK